MVFARDLGVLGLFAFRHFLLVAKLVLTHFAPSSMPSDFNAEARQPDIFARRVGAQADRGNAEVAQDLRAEANVEPIAGARIVSAPSS